MNEPTLSEFLLARIAEDEVLCRNAMGVPDWWPERILAECEAKRRIVEAEPEEWPPNHGWAWACRALAAVYSDHPDYARITTNSRAKASSLRWVAPAASTTRSFGRITTAEGVRSSWRTPTLSGRVPSRAAEGGGVEGVNRYAGRGGAYGPCDHGAECSGDGPDCYPAAP